MLNAFNFAVSAGAHPFQAAGGLGAGREAVRPPPSVFPRSHDLANAKSPATTLPFAKEGGNLAMPFHQDTPTYTINKFEQTGFHRTSVWLLRLKKGSASAKCFYLLRSKKAELILNTGEAELMKLLFQINEQAMRNMKYGTVKCDITLQFPCQSGILHNEKLFTNLR